MFKYRPELLWPSYKELNNAYTCSHKYHKAKRKGYKYTSTKSNLPLFITPLDI